PFSKLLILFVVLYSSLTVHFHKITGNPVFLVAVKNGNLFGAPSFVDNVDDWHVEVLPCHKPVLSVDDLKFLVYVDWLVEGVFLDAFLKFLDVGNSQVTVCFKK